MGFESDAELQTHMESKCKFIPKKIRKTAPVSEGVQRLRRATRQQAMPDVQVTAEDGTTVTLAKSSRDTYLGHQLTDGVDTKPDMEHRMQITSAVFFKHLHLWKQ